MTKQCTPLQGLPVARRAVVVTPSSLTKNWRDEVRRWLGDERLQVALLTSGAEAKQQVVHAPMQMTNPVRDLDLCPLSDRNEGRATLGDAWCTPPCERRLAFSDSLVWQPGSTV